jgi:peptidoglycan/LPS O-acetylase OafA/YrhL
MIKSLEGGRGIAALIVALYHLQIGSAHLSMIRNGYLFVDLFFVLSGFVICAAYGTRMDHAGEFRSFFIRRAGRLVPLLIFSTLFFIFMANAIILAKKIAIAQGYGALLNNPGTLEFVVPRLTEIVSVLTLTHGMGVFDRLILNTPSWSISTEFYTYLLFAAVCLCLKGRLRLLAFFMLAASGFAVCVIASIRVHDCLNQGGCLGLTYDYGFPRSVFSFFLGALIYRLSLLRRFGSTALQVAGLAALAALLSLNDTMPAVAFAFPFVFALLILSVCTDRGALAELLKLRPFQMLGRRSYSIYLMHMPLMLVFENIARRVNGPLSGAAVLLAYVAVLLILSGWTYKWIEDPFRIRFNRIAGKGDASRRDTGASSPALRSPAAPEHAVLAEGRPVTEPGFPPLRADLGASLRTGDR